MPKHTWGGARPGSGKKVGQTNKIPQARVATQYGDKILEALETFMNSKVKRDRKWAIAQLLPYAIQKPTQPMSLNGEFLIRLDK